ncbi:diguanylate cyclase [uncultured Thiodictyon sp.]|uniref:diguanylate cyclase n=1 Tax=uncultured Thiodictyon sp. TaxID=1846217 RepID=UPI0025EA0466|nr:diguanylate cyclase [uncultured Thiodictyon sp.]
MNLTRINALASLPRRPKVLVVDGQPRLLQASYYGLDADCDLCAATDGPTTIEFCTQTPPDLVLLDDELPGANVLQVLEQLQATRSLQNIPVIFVTAHTDSDRETTYLNAGAVDFVTKPVNPSVLRSRATTQLLLKFQSDQLSTMAFRDRLTGAYSRRYFEEQIGIECGRAQRDGTVVSLLRVDLDAVTAYHEYYGHQAGEDALRLVARLLESQLHRPGDIIARYGEAQFVCLLPATDFEPTMQIAEQIEQAVRARGIGHASAAAAPVVTVSIGVSTRRRATDGGAEALLRLADEQLGQAKERGGGRVCGKVLNRP